MIDASSQSFDQNVEIVCRVVEYAHLFGVSVEAELGSLAGIEDDVSVPPKQARYTAPHEAAEFIQKTNIDSLAIAIGTSHGPNKGLHGNPVLSIETLRKIKAAVGKFPLVLHGASSVYPDDVAVCNTYGASIGNAYGITENDIKEAIKHGVAKINVDTDLRIAALGALRKFLCEHSEKIDMRGYLGAARDAVKNTVIKKLTAL
jgi:fructose-bisphosphate aldolase class II